MDPLRDQLEHLRLERNRELRERFDRDLPFADGLFDRWERARRLGWGEGASVYDSAFVFGDVHVGEDAWIGPYTVLDGSGGALRIGRWTQVSAGAQLYTHDTVARALTGGEADRRTGATTVGERTYIGPNAVLAAGCSVGDGCIVAANSFVNADVVDGTAVGGAPARHLGRVVVDGSTVRIVNE